MSLRNEFIALAKGKGVNKTELARRFGISRKTAYKWLNRAAASEPLSDRSRRPHNSPKQTTDTCEQAVVDLRLKHPQWGGRKLHRVLLNAGHSNVPAPSTITHILRRHGLLSDESVSAQGPWKRFEHPLPNDLWQMDFKGTIAIGEGRCDPLTVLDDHSRYNVILHATPDMRGATVQAVLTDAFRRYGMPVRMNMDNGSPWGNPNGDSRGLSTFSLWLVRLGIRVSFSAPAHPQTNGKDERFHRSFKAEVLQGRVLTDPVSAQEIFNTWRNIYNTVRPHEGIDMAVPSDRYRPSPRIFPEVLPAIEYAPQDTIVKVLSGGIVNFQGHKLQVSKALRGLPIAFRPDDAEDGIYKMYFAHHRLARIDMREVD